MIEFFRSILEKTLKHGLLERYDFHISAFFKSAVAFLSETR